MNAGILVVEANGEQRDRLFALLATGGYAFNGVASVDEALALVKSRKPSAVLLDISPREASQFEFTRSVTSTLGIPLIALSSHNEENEVIRALDAGARDYVLVPFRDGELLARLRAAMRPDTHNVIPRVVEVGDLRLDLVERRACVGTQDVPLTPTEFKLVLALAREPGRPVRHEQLLTSIWGPTFTGDVHYLRVFIKLLRSKLEPNPAKPTRIVTVTGVGYQLAV